ncbi:MAG: putative DNA binding domain-containing protein [Kiritimatiellae bacterium]|nr:putative DNA binding domain-containing protein [Kiritimatiellia bacterium]
MKLTARQIERLVKQGEVVHTECKDASGGLPDALWESYSSFANTDGGVIILGVKEVDRKFSIAGVPKAATLIKRFWDGVNNREKVSVNILFDRHVYSVRCRGRDVVVIEVPRADRQDRPVYIGKDMFGGTFRRNGEGDYHCPRESVKAMVRDACVETADACLLEELTVDDLCPKTIRSYRNRFKSKKPEHVWNDLPDEEFLVRIRAARRGEDGKVHPNIAGLVCFAEFGQIMDVLPDFFLDYREKLSTDTRWTDRVAAHDATWSGNIYDFYMMIYDRITSHVKVPFELDADGLRVEENEIHKSLRELLANALIHADYHGRRGIVIEKQAQTISFANPGIFRVNKVVAVEGGTSDARNSHIFNIFALVDIGERSGTGLADLYGHWKKNKLPAPVIAEEYDPDRVKITVYMDSDQDPTKTRSRPDQSAQSAPDVPQKCPKSAPKVPQVGPSSTPESAQGDPRVTQGDPRVTQGDPSLMQDFPAAAKQVFRELVQDPKMTLRGLATKLGFSKTTVTTAIGILVANKIIRREGNKQTGHWEVVK